MHRVPSGSIFVLLSFLITALFAGCVGTGAKASTTPAGSTAVLPASTIQSGACPVTKAVLLKPPEDPTVSGPPEPGYFFTNEDQTILASAWWVEQPEYHLQAVKEGVKVGWFRPEGTDLTITGRRIDAPSPPLKAEVPCCYPGRFQATGLVFSTPGCWKVTGRASGKTVTFVIRVEP